MKNLKSNFVVVLLFMLVTTHSKAQSWLHRLTSNTSPITSHVSRGIKELSNGELMLVSIENTDRLIFTRFNAQGVIQSTFGFKLKDVEIKDVLIDNTNIIVVGWFSFNSRSTGFILNVTSTGTVNFSRKIIGRTVSGTVQASYLIRVVQLQTDITGRRDFVVLGTDNRDINTGDVKSSVLYRLNQNTGLTIWQRDIIPANGYNYILSYSIVPVDNVGNPMHNYIVLGGAQVNGDYKSFFCLFNPNTGVLVSTLNNYFSYSNGVNFSTGGNIDYLVALPNSNRVYAGFHSNRNSTVTRHGVTELDVSNTGVLSVTQSRIYHPQFGTGVVSRVSCMSISPNGQEILIGTLDQVNNYATLFHKIRVSDLSTIYNRTPTLDANEGYKGGSYLSFSSSGDVLYSAGIKNSSTLEYELMYGRTNFSDTNYTDCLLDSMLTDSNVYVKFDVVPSDATVGDHFDSMYIYETPSDHSYYVKCSKCYYEDDSNTQQLAGPITVNTNTVFTGKVYVKGVITFSGNITIDITNCDFIFDRCSQLVFDNGALLRANNSVFRPCNINDYWTGITFMDGTNHKINECTFKHAINAVEISNSTSDIRVVNNLFQDNYRGILLNSCTITGAISTNTFEIFKSNVNLFDNYPCFSNPGTDLSFNGIRLLNSTVNSTISQNNFINHGSDPGFKGMVLINPGTFVITKSRFTQNETGIEVSGGIGGNTGKIEYNELDVHYDQNFTPSHQIILVNTSMPILILGNKIDMHHFTSAPIGQIDAIHCEGTNQFPATTIQIENNSITGFSDGIFLYFVNNSIVTENHIRDAYNVGIENQNCSQIYVGCNEIDLDFGASPSIGILSTDIDQASNFFTNCVLDCNTSMAFQNTNLAPAPLPNIRNNFIYNYLNNGIYVNNYNGSIGMMGLPGLNTLYTNFLTAWDMNSTIPITAFDNFVPAGILNGVTLLGSAFKHSSSSCGKQIIQMHVQVNYEGLFGCHEVQEEVQGPIMLTDNGNFELRKESSFKSIMDKYRSEQLASFVYTNPAIYSWINSSNQSPNELIKVHALVANNNFKEALLFLNSINPINSVEYAYYQTLRQMIEAKSGKYSFDTSLIHNTSVGNQAIMSLNLNKASAFRLNLTKGASSIPDVNAPNGFYRGNLNSNIYPNPAHNVVKIFFNNTTDIDAQITITDLSSNTVVACKMPSANPYFEIPLKNVSPGIYVVAIKSQDIIKQYKLIVE